jgi:hypothetical protein
MSYETRKFRWHRVGEDGRRFKGVRPLNGWVARIYLRNGFSEQLDGVFGTAVDAAICRNYWIAFNDDEYGNRYNEIPADEMWHD